MFSECGNQFCCVYLQRSYELFQVLNKKKDDLSKIHQLVSKCLKYNLTDLEETSCACAK